MVCAVIHWPFLIIMRASDRATARKNIDRRLAALGNPQKLSRPPYGWIKAIREALGMTSRQFAKRMGVSQPRASAIEKNEVIGSITLDTLQRAANALDCQLVYALVPRKPLQALVKERAEKLAITRVKSAAHSMALEDQSVAEEDEAEQVEALTRELENTEGSALWEQ